MNKNQLAKLFATDLAAQQLFGHFLSASVHADYDRRIAIERGDFLLRHVKAEHGGF